MELLLIFAWLVLGIFFSNSLFVEPVRFELIEIDLVDVKIDRVIGDKYERLAFDREIRNRNESMYASKFDYLMDINETNDIFPGYYEFQTILFLVTIIFVIMLTACHFGNILRLYSHFQKILATVNKIISSINILLPIFLPATTQAATITYDDTEFHVKYYDLFMYIYKSWSPWLYSVLLFGHEHRFGTVLIQEILENYMKN